MALPAFLRILHLAGFALLVTSTIGGWIVFSRYRRLEDFRLKAALLGASRSLGLLSPVGIVLMLVTGIGQMHLFGYGLFVQAWLTLKVLFFVIAATAGIVFAVRSRARAVLVRELAQTGEKPEAVAAVARLDSQQRVFYLIQSTLLLLILLLSVMKPGP
jgi:hypothetical protein